MGTAADIVGRRPELHIVSEARREAVTEGPVGVLVVGDAGVGKSTLLAAAGAAAEADGWQVEVGHCVELAGGALPFGPVAEVLRRVVAERGESWIRDSVGDLAARLQPLTSGGATVGNDRPAVFAGLVAVVEALAADQPTMLAIEDVHWADRSTLDVLDLLVRTAINAPLVVLATLRGDELHRRHPTRVWAAELARHPRVRQIELRPFDLDDLSTLITRLDGAAPQTRVLRDLHQRTEGNAFFVEALLSAPADRRHRLPERLADVLLTRLDVLEPASRRVVDVAAAAGRGIDHRLLAAVAGLDDAALRDGLRGALDAGALVRTADGHGYRIRHALLREVAHDELLPGERRELHHALAAALEAEPGLALSPTGPHGELAYHWQQAHDHARTYTASLVAAREAAGMAAYAEALEHTERALELWDVVPADVRAAGPRRDRLLHNAGTAALTAEVGGLKQLRAAVDEARRVDAPVADVLQSLLRLAYGEWSKQHADVAISVAEEAVALVEDDEPALLVHALGELARLHLLVGRVAVARPMAERAVALAGEVDGAEAESVARNSLGVALFAAGETERAEEELRTALRLARRAGDQVEIGRAVTNLTDVLAVRGRLDEAQQTVTELAATVVTAGGLARHLSFARLNVAMGLLDRLRIAEAAAHIDPVRLTGRYGVMRQYALLARARLALHTGDLAGCRRLVEQGRDGLGRPLPDLQMAGPLIDVAVWAALLDDDPKAALEAAAWLLDLADEWEGSTLHPSWQLGVRAAVAVALRARAAGDIPEADQAAARARAWAERGEAEDIGRPDYDPARAARVAATRAVVARLDGTAADTWSAERAHLSGAQGLWRVQIAVEAAGDLAAAGRTGAAAEHLADAEPELALLAHGHPLRRLAEDLRARSRDGDDALLTPREQEVIVLVAAGRTNREIGDQLFVSEKTVSVHVSNILRKLGVTNRVEAAGAAQRLGLV